VISVGNLTMGGTGKTPCVLYLARLLGAAGHTPAILTRGYGRHALAGDLAVAPGAPVSTEESGDEPQIFIRSGLAPVGIGGDRARTAALLLERFAPGVFLLDDGFQHVRLKRDLDIVLIDALDPFGGGAVFPLGRLREPVRNLARADAVIITRSQFSDLAPAIENAVRRVNPRVPVFRAGIEPEAWVDAVTGAIHPLAQPPFAAAGGFCGLGNPQSFRRTLERLRVPPAAWFEFDDHHRFRPRELRSMAHQAGAAGATALVTTEKDVVNLCADFREAIAPIEVYWLKVRMTVDREREFLRLVTALFSSNRRRHGE
jgi:tetraacyldisaccharide 4'-kinase